MLGMDQALPTNEEPTLEMMPAFKSSRTKKVERFQSRYLKAKNDFEYGEASDVGRSMKLEKALAKFQKSRRIVQSQLQTISNIKGYIAAGQGREETLKNHEAKLVIKVMQLRYAKMLLERSVESKSQRNKGKDDIRALAFQELEYLKSSGLEQVLLTTPTEMDL